MRGYYLFSMWSGMALMKRWLRAMSDDAAPSSATNNLVFGGKLPSTSSIKMGSLGRILYDRLTEPQRADNTLQVSATTGQTMTTKTFLRQSVAVAEALRDHNIGRGDFIFVVGNNSLNMNVTLTGIFFLGAVPVPISYFANPEDIRHLVTFLQPKFFVCDADTIFTIRRIVSGVLGHIDERKIFLLDNESECTDTQLRCFSEFIKGRDGNYESFKPTEVTNPGEELALVMKSFQEGAADRGVGITHANIHAILSRYEATRGQAISSEVMLMVQKIIWMSGIYSLLLSCCFGSKLVVMPEFDEVMFMKTVQEHKVTTCYLYATKLWQLYKYNYPEKYDLSSGQRMFAVGSSIPKHLIRLMKEKTGLAFKLAYGIVEMTGIVIESSDTTKPGSVGKVVPTFYAKVVSPRLNQRVGPNVYGELCFKGDGLMKGYVNDEKSTRDSIDQEGFFHSGDYGYYDEDGDFFIFDQLREVILYRDNEVSPLEIEGVLRTLDAVKDCVVSGIAHPKDGHRAVAFVVLQSGKTLTAEEIIKYVESKLPEHKHLKGGVVFIPKVPRSRESGFIKRRAIRRILSKYRFIDDTEDLQKSKPEAEPSKNEGKDTKPFTTPTAKGAK